MPDPTQPDLDAAGLRFAIVTSRYNETVTTLLTEGARDALLSHNARPENITEITVPGAWELPLAARSLARSGRYDALICLGCVIRGETTHHVHIGGDASRGLSQIALECNIPIGFGVLTTENLEQAVERAGGRVGNKGADAALTAIEMARLLKDISDKTRTEA